MEQFKTGLGINYKDKVPGGPRLHIISCPWNYIAPFFVINVFKWQMKDKLSKQGPPLVAYVTNLCNSRRLLGNQVYKHTRSSTNREDRDQNVALH